MNLAAEMGKLPEPPNDSAPPLWSYWQHDLWVRAQTEDARQFMHWPCIFHTMLQEHWREAMDIERMSMPDDVIRHIRELSIYDERSEASARNLIHQAYHILRWQEATGLRIADMRSIYEFGGGYGAMALVCNRLGFRGQYYIYDLPEFALLQQWYLGECGVSGVEWVDTEFCDRVGLFIACYSLSETDYAERDRILFNGPAADSYLFLYSNKFEQFDNLDYFQNGPGGVLDFAANWQHAKIEHLPPESWYSWGW